jgi:hypothetical protein
MRRIFSLSGLPSLPQLLLAVFTQFERLISLGGGVPVAVGALVAYFVLIGRRPAARA